MTNDKGHLISMRFSVVAGFNKNDISNLLTKHSEGENYKIDILIHLISTIVPGTQTDQAKKAIADFVETIEDTFGLM